MQFGIMATYEVLNTIQQMSQLVIQTIITRSLGQ